MDNTITVLDANYLSTYLTADEKEQIMIEKAANLSVSYTHLTLPTTPYV